MENPDEILTHVSNRYYPLPPKPWLLYQEWHQVLLLHWKIDPKLLLRLIPEHLQLDTFDGSAYISIIAFNVENFRSSAGKLPFISSFQEINVRTYVTCNGIKGIYFFSLYADKLLAVIGAKLFYRLPYRSATIEKQEKVLRAQGNYLRLKVSYETGALINDRTPLDIWLSERHAFYQQIKNKVYRCDIHHREWPLEKVSVKEQSTFIAVTPPVQSFLKPFDAAHYAGYLAVLFWNRVSVS